jgi:hypothetical protein
VADFFDIIYLWQFFGFFDCVGEGGVFAGLGFFL